VVGLIGPVQNLAQNVSRIVCVAIADELGLLWICYCWSLNVDSRRYPYLDRATFPLD
jgi:hypothetical protein